MIERRRASPAIKRAASLDAALLFAPSMGESAARALHRGGARVQATQVAARGLADLARGSRQGEGDAGALAGAASLDGERGAWPGHRGAGAGAALPVNMRGQVDERRRISPWPGCSPRWGRVSPGWSAGRRACGATTDVVSPCGADQSAGPGRSGALKGAQVGSFICILHR